MDSGTFVVTVTVPAAPLGSLQSTVTGVFGCVEIVLEHEVGVLPTVIWMLTMAPSAGMDVFRSFGVSGIGALPPENEHVSANWP